MSEIEALKHILAFMSWVIIQVQISICKQSNIIQHFHQNLHGAWSKMLISAHFEALLYYT